MNKIFISYSRKNTENIDVICRRLDELSIGYWRDRNEISSTEYNFTKSFAGGVKNCDYFLIYLTDDYIDSYYCWLELMNSMINKKCMKYIIFNGDIHKYKFSPDELLGGVSFGLDKSDFSDLMHNSCGKISANNIFSLKENVKIALKLCDIESSRDFYRILMVLILSEISIINCGNGDYNRMMHYINEMEKISQDIIHSPIFIYAVLLDRMALCASKMGRYSEAVRFRKNSLDHCVVNFGEDNMEALEVRYDLRKRNFQSFLCF